MIKDYIEADSDLVRTSEDETSFENPDSLLPKSIENVEFNENENIYGEGINVLLRLIKYAHTDANSKNTGLTNLFDFSSFFTRLQYYNSQTRKIDCKALKRFIDSYYLYCTDHDIDYLVKDSFVNYLEENYEYVSDAKKSAFKTFIDCNWEDIKNRIIIIYDVAQVISDAEIGVIQISDITSSDQQKIFDLINTKGTKLTPAEVLSAKPAWNVVIDNPSAKVKEETEKLYNFIDVESNGVVKWDLAATFVNRLKRNEMFLYSFDDDNNSTSVFEKNVGLGFKLLAGIYEDGVRQDDIRKLSLKTSINWNCDIDELVSNLNDMFKVISDHTYFRYFKSWNKNIMQLLSDGAGINFILYMYKYWKNIESPLSYAANARNFQKNAFIFYDRMIYEYLLDQWKGSSDAKIAKYLQEVPSHKVDFIPVEKEKWLEVINGLIDDNKLADNLINSHSKLTPILYHYYCLINQSGPDAMDTVDVDHIMPQVLFDNSRIDNKEYLKHNLCNLALLPKKTNISKSDKRLNEITDNWLKEQIVKYESILIEDFEKYSNINNFNDLREKRKELFIKAFSSKRDDLLNN